MHPFRILTAGLLLFAVAAGSVRAAGIEVKDAWARATLPGQAVGGVYMQITSAAPARVVGVRTASAKRAELHEMSNEGGVMRMRKLDGLALPAGKPVLLAPGGNHVMLFDLARPLKAGERLMLTLQVEQGGKRTDVPVTATVRAAGDDHAH